MPPDERLYPALFLCHGAGPLPLLGEPSHQPMVRAWRDHWAGLTTAHGPPRAIAVLLPRYPDSGGGPVVGASLRPALLRDYGPCGDLPPAAHHVAFAPRGNAALALRMVAALRAGGLPAARCDPQMPLPPEAFVPLSLMAGAAIVAGDIPIVPVTLPPPPTASAGRLPSSVSSGDGGGGTVATQCVRLGRALRPFRAEGVLFIGSGATVFSPACLRGERVAAATTFTASLSAAVCGEHYASGDRLLLAARVGNFAGYAGAHTDATAAHLMPLLACVGLAGGAAGRQAAEVPLLRTTALHFVFES